MNYLNKEGLKHLIDKIKSIIPTKTSQLINDSGYTTGYTAGSGVDITDNVISVKGGVTDSGTYDYDELVNHPKINGIELSGDKSTNELGINIPTKLSDLEDDSYLTTIKTGERRWGTYAKN